LLIEKKFAAYSVFPGSVKGVKAMKVDYAEVAGNLRAGVESALTILEGR
jgi:hypothetical protein